MHESFFVDGFVHGKLNFDAVSMFKDFEFPDCNSPTADDYEFDPSAKLLLDTIHLNLEKLLIQPVFKEYTFGECGMWSGVDPGSSKWHNDFIDGDPFTSNILIYLEDNEPYGNSIEVKSPFSEHKIIPKPNEFVWINQNKKFLHRATHNSGPRRLLSFEFYIPALV